MRCRASKPSTRVAVPGVSRPRHRQARHLRFTLAEGQFLHVEVAQTTEATAVAALFGPGTTDVTNVSAALGSGDISQQTSFTADFTAKAGQAGEYYLSVAAQSGASTYTVD